MGQAKQRGSYEQRKIQAISVKSVQLTHRKIDFPPAPQHAAVMLALAVLIGSTGK